MSGMHANFLIYRLERSDNEVGDGDGDGDGDGLDGLAADRGDNRSKDRSTAGSSGSAPEKSGGDVAANGGGGGGEERSPTTSATTGTEGLEMEALISRVKRTVFDASGYELEEEVCRVPYAPPPVEPPAGKRGRGPGGGKKRGVR